MKPAGIKNKAKKLFLSLVILSGIGITLAHEFWLEPQYFQYSYGDEINIRFKVGEHFAGENWKGNHDKVQQLRLYYSDIEDDLSDALSDDAGDSLQLTLFEEGTALIAFNSTNSFIQLEAPKFNEYLLEDGLTNATEYRKQNGETDSTGKEYYQRSVKTLIQIGAAKTDLYKKTTNLPLDISLLSHPYLISQATTMKARLLFKGEPLQQARVRVWHKLAGKVSEETFTSDSSGIVSFPVEPSGEWMVSSVYMERLTDDPKADWQSYWGSFTWGYTGKIVYRKKAR